MGSAGYDSPGPWSNKKLKLSNLWDLKIIIIRYGSCSENAVDNGRIHKHHGGQLDML